MKKALPSLRTLVKTAMISSYLLAAHTAIAETNKQQLSHMPGATVQGLLSNYTMGYADMMMPLIGRPQSFLHLNPQALIQDGSEYALSLGSGFRHLTDNAGILGAYVFGDYNHSPNGNGFWFVSPGIERLGEIVDFSANLYIPASDQRKNLSERLSGMCEYTTFAGHSQYDRVLRSFESTGPGADAEIGFRIPAFNNPKFYIGGYYFDPEDANDNTEGLTARLEAPLTDELTLVLSDSYDSVQHNTAKIGLQYSFGARRNSRNFKGNLNQRMVDPIHRNLVATTGPSHTAQPIVQTYNKIEEKVITKDHIAFFNIENTRPGDGTYENPFQQMIQDNVDTANLGGNNNFYINTGTYNIDINQGITLTNDNVYGRQNCLGNPFVLAAEGNNRPLFQFGPSPILSLADLIANEIPPFPFMFKLTSNTHNLFDSVRLEGIPDASYGILIDNNATALHQDSLLINNTSIAHFSVGLAYDDTPPEPFAQSTKFGDMEIPEHLQKYLLQSWHSGLPQATVAYGGNIDVTITNSDFHENTIGTYVAAQEANVKTNIKNSTFDLDQIGLFVSLGNGIATANLQNISMTHHSLFGALINSDNDITVNIFNSNFSNNTVTGASLFSEGTKLTANIQNSHFHENGAGLFVGGNDYIDLNVQNSHLDKNEVGLSVIQFSGAMDVHIKHSSFNENIIRGFSAVNVNTPTAVNFDIEHSQFNGNGEDGIDILGDNALSIAIKHSQMNANGVHGLVVGQVPLLSIFLGGLDLDIQDSSFNSNGGNGLFVTQWLNADIEVNIERSNFNYNGGAGASVESGDSFANLQLNNLLLNVSDSNFYNNTGSGLFLLQKPPAFDPDYPPGFRGIYTAVITDSRIANNGDYGIKGVNMSGINGVGEMNITIADSVLFSNNTPEPTNCAPGDNINWTPDCA